MLHLLVDSADKHLRSVLSCFFAEKCRLPCLNDAWLCSGADRYVARCGLYCGFSWTGVQPRAGTKRTFMCIPSVGCASKDGQLFILGVG